MMHRLVALRKTARDVRLRQDSLSPVKPIFTGSARKSVTASDLEGMETVSFIAHAADGSFPHRADYDDIPAYP